jgi:hypothetical protein
MTGQGAVNFRLLAAAVLVLAGTGAAQPEPWFHPDSTIHWYDPIVRHGGVAWDAALDSAKSLGGYLATVTSDSENSFVFGLVDREDYWVMRSQPAALSGPWLGGYQLPGSNEPGDGWVWVTGEPFDLPGWSPGEPDNLGGNENALHFGGLTEQRVPTWDDLPDDDSLGGFVVELSADSTTIGLIRFDSSDSPGYTLMAPMDSPLAFLIDNKGREVHRWQSRYRSALAAALLEDGSLLRVANTSPEPFLNGGRVEIFDWDGNLTWSYDAADSTHAQHHDAIRLPNGNVLMIAYEYKSRDQAVAAGRDPDRLLQGFVLPDHLIEVEPTTNDIVWEWHAWDHLVQQYDSTRANYGLVRNHPELIDVNFGPITADWLHCNGLDYNAAFDQVMISNHNFCEVWVIDHSTTTEQARGHSGGRYGMGGDLLYRWGNPQAYGAGGSGDQRFFGQHSTHWIRSGLRGAGDILVFNNGFLRPDDHYSTVEQFTPPSDSLGRFARPALGEPFGPAAPNWVYGDSQPFGLFSIYISGAQRLPNGHTLVCDGDHGRIFEVGPDSQVVWQYLNPVYDTFFRYQGDKSGGPRVFRAPRYAPDYPGLAGRELTPGYPLEKYQTPLSSVSEPPARAPRPAAGLTVAPNPTRGYAVVRFSLPAPGPVRLAVYDESGRLVRTLLSSRAAGPAGALGWDCTDNSGRKVGAGVYLLRLTAGSLTRASRLTVTR